MKGLNLSAFEKVNENENTVTMKHKDGHTINIALKALPKIQREQIKRLKMAKGGVVKNYAGDDDKPEDSVVQSDNATPDTVINVNGSAPAPTPAPPLVPAPAAQFANQNIPVEQPNVNPQNPNVLLPNGSMSAPGVAQTGQQAASEQEKIDISKGAAAANLERGYAQQRAQLAQQDANNIAGLKTATDNFNNYIQKNPINPRSYVQNMGASQKVATGIGLFLGGMSVPTGGHNFAQDFLNNQINLDVDAQKTNAQNQKTVWGAYNELYGNQNVATGLAKASMADIYTHKAQQIAAQLGTPQAIANYHALASNLAETKNKGILEAAGSIANTPNNPSGGNLPQQGTNEGPSNTNIKPVSAPGPLNEEQPPAQSHEFNILTPGAADSFPQMLKYDHTIDEREKTQMEEQMKGSSLAEQGLKRLDNEQIFEKLAAITKAGGYTERLRRGLTPNALGALGAGTGAAIGGASTKSLGGAGAGAGVGSALGEAAGHLIPPSERNNEYFALKQQLGGVLSAALAGRGDTFVREALDRFTPEYNDTPQILKEKYRGLKAYIIDHTPHDALQRHGLAYK